MEDTNGRHELGRIIHQPASPVLELLASRLFMSWLAEQRVSLAFTTYQAGKLFLLGQKPDGREPEDDGRTESLVGRCGSTAQWPATAIASRQDTRGLRRRRVSQRLMLPWSACCF